MASRHRSRELVVQMVYQWGLGSHSLDDAVAIDRFWKGQAQSADDNREFFEHLIHGVAKFLPAIDRKLEAALKNWKFDRVEKVDLAILRLAIYELFFSDPKERLDRPIVINEALEISKKFGTKDSSSFVNGILDALCRQEGTPA